MSYSQCISPQQLVGTSERTTPGWIDPALYMTGNLHLIPFQIPLTPHLILSGSYDDVVGYSRYLVLGREKKYCGEPSFPSILFSIRGKPGPTMKEIMQGTIRLDGAQDMVIAHHGWSRVKCYIDWPCHKFGYTASIPATGHDNMPISRELLAKEVCGLIYMFLEKNRGITIHWSVVRLVALSYYRNTWVPVLAIDG